MGKLQIFNIEFENQTGIYFVGSVVNGRVVVALQEPMKMRAIRIRFNGEASVSFSRRYRRNNNERDESVRYRGSVLYIQTDVTLWGNLPGASGDPPTLQPGSYQFPFSFQLPPQCPTSFEGLHGSIRYACKATIDKPWKFDHTTKRPFTVLSAVDLNTFPNLSMPISAEKIKEMGVLCCKSGNIQCQVKIPRSGYVPGELILIDMNVTNSSSSTVKKVQIRLVEHVTFRGQRTGGNIHAPANAVMNTNRTVAIVSKGEILPSQTQIWKNEGLLIPPVAPSLTTCSILQVGYMVHIEIDPSGAHTDLDLDVPITIGTIPLRSAMQQLNQNFQKYGVSGQADPPPTNQGSFSYPDLPPPSYKDVIFGSSNITEEGDNNFTSGQLSFAPKYPYYNWSQQQIQLPPQQANVSNEMM